MTAKWLTRNSHEPKGTCNITSIPHSQTGVCRGWTALQTPTPAQPTPTPTEEPK